jgi:hypothetical protein
MELHALGYATLLRRREGFVEGDWRVRVQVILDHLSKQQTEWRQQNSATDNFVMEV